ncbi:MAG: ATP-binding cassette domain-containing protein [Motiliproteus sp.]
MYKPAIFELSNQRISHGNQTLLEVESLTIGQHEKVALIGRSGSGKSTLLRLLRSQAPKACAICPQHLGLVPSLSVFHNIYMGALHRHPSWFNLLNLIKPNPKIHKQIEALCAVLELDGKTSTSVDRLSGGQMQRTALGRALYQQADIFLGDEPVSSVDSHQAQRIIDIINEAHTTVVIALHDQQLAKSHFNRIIGLHQGRIVLDTTSDQVTEADINAIYQA